MTPDPFSRLRDVRDSPRRIVAITAYDFPSAKLVDDLGIDMILVGDSLGMVVAGLPDTTGVTMDQMVYHTEIVARGVEKTLLVSDLPYQSYDTVEQALENGRRLADAGADAVKLEGGSGQKEKIAALTSAGIPVVGHLGMLPQRVREEGGYKKKGKTEAETEHLLRSATDLQEAGVGAFILEGVVPDVAARMTAAVEAPTIGIGSGTVCDGEIRVLHDIIGAYPWFVPPFADPQADVAGEIRRAVAAYRDSVATPTEA